MLSDLAALTPPLIVCAAFVAGVIIFLRRQMKPGGRDGEAEDPGHIRDDESENTRAGDHRPTPPPGQRRA